jgi:DNA-binding CsgD family transcriptional regulator
MDLEALVSVRPPETPFVGRAAERKLLRERLTAARAGRGGVALIAGEAGIGKSTLARAAAAEAERAGARILWGHLFEGGWSPPFFPWTEALGGLAGMATPEQIAAILRAEDPTGASISGLAKLAPALGLELPQREPAELLEPEEERFRLYDGVARLLLALAAQQSLLIVLDDLQWADRGTLDLLRHVVHLAPAAPLFILGTYRDGELDAEHPLSALLPLMRREADLTAIHLSGLDAGEIAELIARDTVLAESIRAETDGNPFFVGELITDWRDRQIAIGEGVPEGVRQVIERRIARLSRVAERLIGQAAVFSAGFAFAVLPPLTELPEDDLLDAIDELIAARFIAPVAGAPLERYDFVHAIARRTITERLSPSRRVRLERRAAEAMERAYGAQAEAYAAEIAAHYSRSASLPGAEAGLPHALVAAEVARRGYDRTQVMRFLRISRELGVRAGADSRAEVLTKLAVAEADAVLIAESCSTAEEALTALHESGANDDEVAAFIADLVTVLKQSASAETRVWRPWLERGLAVAAKPSQPWARLTLLIDAVEPVSRERIRVGRWRGFDPEAVAVARGSGDEMAAARAVESFDFRTRVETEAYLEQVRGWSHPAAVMYGLTVSANDLQYRHGAFRDAAQLWEELIALAERHGAISWQAQANNQLTWIEIAMGRFVEARASEARANALLDRLGPGRRSPALTIEMATAFAFELGGDWRELAEFWTASVDDPTLGPHDPGTLIGGYYAALAAYCRMEAGERDAARSMLDALTPILQQLTPEDANHNGAVAVAAAVVWRLGLVDLAPAYLRLGLDLQEAGLGDYPQTSIALTVARMAALLGRQSDAGAAFARARQTLELSGPRPLRAVADMDEALMLLRAGDPAGYGRIVALLDAATVAFDGLGMTPWSAKARELRIEAEQRLSGRVSLPGGLTEREADVVRLVARGYSDRQVSDELYISPRTVNAHLRNMLNKTATANRTELSVWAIEHGLVAPETPGR